MIGFTTAIKAILLVMLVTFYISLVIRVVRDGRYVSLVDLAVNSVVLYVLILLYPFFMPHSILKDKKRIVNVLTKNKDKKSKEYKKCTKLVSTKRFAIKLGLWIFYNYLKNFDEIIEISISCIKSEEEQPEREYIEVPSVINQYKNPIIALSVSNMSKIL